MKPTVFVPEPIHAAGMQLLQNHCTCIAPWQKNANAIEPSQALAQTQAILVRLFTVDSAAMDQAPHLKVIAKHGVGLDNIDLPEAARRGLPVLYTPQANSNAVAEHALGLILGLARFLVPSGQAVPDAEKFLGRNGFAGAELVGSTLGIIGLGRIGRRLAHKTGTGLEMDVLAYDPYVSQADYEGPARLLDRLEDVLAQADFISLHTPLTAQTRHLIDADALGHCKSTAYLINTARGGIVDPQALAQALDNGRLAGAGIDVFAEEPPPADYPLFNRPNVLLTPHIAGVTHKALEKVATDAAQGIIDVLQGQTPEFPVPEDQYRQ
ncbi:MAG: hydroxyacid dehydrogenase [Candidatus Latescibacteria bacterium]|nr:hydroxyacid dehydrogenase [Candidatus Latescibacterota bacterium]